jgi:hypothetical protein
MSEQTLFYRSFINHDLIPGLFNKMHNLLMLFSASDIEEQEYLTERKLE